MEMKIMELLPSLVSAGSLLSGALIYWFNAKKERNRRQQEYLEKMMEKFLRNKVRKLVHMFDSSDGVDAYLQKLWDSNHGDGDEGFELDELLFMIEHLFYLRAEKAISEKEFAFFESDIIKTLSSAGIQRYLVDYLGTGINRPESFRLIKDFLEAKILWVDSVKKEMSNPDDEADGVGTTIAGEQETVTGEITAEEFKAPMIFIRINRNYREGMSRDEVYGVVRGEWKINPESAKGYGWVVAVAHGVVRGVFPVQEWKRSALSDCAGRWRFTKDENIEVPPEMKRWIGKSVKWMFQQGAANPVRYFRPNDNAEGGASK